MNSPISVEPRRERDLALRQKRQASNARDRNVAAHPSRLQRDADSAGGIRPARDRAISRGRQQINARIPPRFCDPKARDEILARLAIHRAIPSEG